MIAVFGLGLLGMVLMNAAEPPGIAGQWTGDDWGEVLREEQ